MAKKTVTPKPEAPKEEGRRSRNLDPHIISPAPTVKVDRLARFVFVPDTGFHCGNAKEWLARGTEEWATLQRTPKLGSFLSTNPMTIVYARLKADKTIEITEISMGGAFLSAKMARGILPFLPWYGDNAQEKKPVVNPDEEGKTLPQPKTATAAA